MRYYGIPQVAHARPPFTAPIARGPRIRSGVYGHPHSLRSSSLPLLGARGFPSCQDARGPKSVNDNVKSLAKSIYPSVQILWFIHGVARFLFVFFFLFLSLFFSNRFIGNKFVLNCISKCVVYSNIFGLIQMNWNRIISLGLFYEVLLTLFHLERLGSLLNADQSRARGVLALRQIPRIVRSLLVDEASVAVLVAGLPRGVQPCHEVVRAALLPRG